MRGWIDDDMICLIPPVIFSLAFSVFIFEMVVYKIRFLCLLLRLAVEQRLVDLLLKF